MLSIAFLMVDSPLKTGIMMDTVGCILKVDELHGLAFCFVQIRNFHFNGYSD